MDSTTPLLTADNHRRAGGQLRADIDADADQTTWETAKMDLHYVIYSSPLNILLLIVPLGIFFGFMELSHTWTFVFNFLAIIPLAAILAYATEELADKAGSTVGGLLNATFGNAVELIVSIIALKEGQVRIVQASFHAG